MVGGAVGMVLVAFTGAAMLKGYGARQYQAGYDKRDVAAARDENDALRRQLALERRVAQLTADVSAKHAAAQAENRARYTQLKDEVPHVLPPQTSSDYRWPVGAVRLHDAAARGLALSDVSDPAGRPDDAPSDVGAADGIGTVLGNYEACEADRKRLSSLQEWNRQVAQ